MPHKTGCDWKIFRGDQTKARRMAEFANVPVASKPVGQWSRRAILAMQANASVCYANRLVLPSRRDFRPMHLGASVLSARRRVSRCRRPSAILRVVSVSIADPNPLSSGDAMYSPVLNRFLSRDPVPPTTQPDILYGGRWITRMLRRMPNAYSYADNRPTRFIDPSGLTISYSPPVEGHPYEDKRIGPGWLAATTFRWTIQCTCKVIEKVRCLADNKCVATIDCDVDLLSSVTLDITAIKKDPGYGNGVTIEGTYGHEQRHVKCFYDLATAAINKLLTSRKYRYNSRSCEDGCLPFVIQLESAIDAAITDIRDKEYKCANPCSPPCSSDDPPMGEMPASPTN